MIEVKTSTSKSTKVKQLVFEADGKIYDADGFEKDLNKIAATIFAEGEVFEIGMTNKVDKKETIDEDGNVVDDEEE